MRCAAVWVALKLEKTPGVSLLPRGSKAEQADKAAQATTTIDKRYLMSVMSHLHCRSGLMLVNNWC